MEGVVIKNTGSSYVVKTEGGEYVECKIKGNFRIKNIRTTNPVAVGDCVCFEKVEKEQLTFITGIADRKNYIIRRASNLSKEAHIIAANVDQAFLIVTINYPETNLIFIDRFLVTAEAYHIPVRLIFNKIDCLNEEETEYMDAVINMYEHIGYPCHKISALNGSGIAEIQDLMFRKITLLSGNSGVGKSTLIKVIAPHLDIKTGEISVYHNKGMHTTTFSEMHELEQGGYIIDTPGIKGFGIVDVKKEEVAHYFPEIFKKATDCKFYNCTHEHEPGCAVKKAVDESEISASRYTSYLNILADIGANKYR